VRTLGPALALAALSLVLTGCGDEDSDADREPFGSRAGAVPLCEDAVADGEPITEKLFETGCEMPNGDRFLFSAFECEDGGLFITYDDRFYGRVGDVWHENRGEPAGDPAYSSFLADC
jgi:hypothetical protein